MKLHFNKIGEGKPLIILHGLFGMSDNWATIAKEFAINGFACYLVDMRNHGRSPHSDQFSYQLMAEDLLELIDDLKLEQVYLLGHSMGGKVAMFFTRLNPGRVLKLIVADISPRYYTPHHQTIIAALSSMDLPTIHSRKEAETQLRISIHDEATIQFLLKNLYWKTDVMLDWRFYLQGLGKNIESIGEEFPESPSVLIPTLFVRGERSGYIGEEDKSRIKRTFPNSEIKTIPNAGHWVHAENPIDFLKKVIQYLASAPGL